MTQLKFLSCARRAADLTQNRPGNASRDCIEVLIVGPIDFIEFHAHFHPRRLAVLEVASGRSWTYLELDDAIARWARVLHDNYWAAPGDRIGALARNRAELLILHFACARIGAIYVPLNWRLAAAELAEIVADVEPVLLVGDEELSNAGLAGAAIDELADLAARAVPLRGGKILPDQASLMLFTSGTSGKPKGAMLSERNLAQLGLNTGLFSRVTRDSRYLIDSPMFHIIGIASCVRPPLMYGGAVILSDGFDAEKTLTRIANVELGITHYFCIPQMATALRRHHSYEPNNFRRLTALFSGGAPHPEPEMLAWLDDGIPIINAYGMSEAGSVCMMPIDIELIRRRPRSVGVRTPGVHARLVDAAMNDCPPGAPGEILLKGENVFLGYWRRPELTMASFTEDGWFRTGDIGVLRDGLYDIVDRKKDMYISGGENIYPAEVEAAMSGFPGLVDVCVVGIPDERWGEVGHMVIVGSEVETEAVMNFLSHRIARYKLPKHVSFAESLPRTGSGKVRKDDLRSSLLRSAEWTQIKAG